MGDFHKSFERHNMTATTERNRSIQGDRFLREPSILEILPIGRSTWWAGVKAGKYPAGIKLSPRVTVWRASDIDSLIATIGK